MDSYVGMSERLSKFYLDEGKKDRPGGQSINNTTEDEEDFDFIRVGTEVIEKTNVDKFYTNKDFNKYNVNDQNNGNSEWPIPIRDDDCSSRFNSFDKFGSAIHDFNSQPPILNNDFHSSNDVGKHADSTPIPTLISTKRIENIGRKIEIAHQPIIRELKCNQVPAPVSIPVPFPAPPMKLSASHVSDHLYNPFSSNGDKPKFNHGSPIPLPNYIGNRGSSNTPKGNAVTSSFLKNLIPPPVPPVLPVLKLLMHCDRPQDDSNDVFKSSSTPAFSSPLAAPQLPPLPVCSPLKKIGRPPSSDKSLPIKGVEREKVDSSHCIEDIRKDVIKTSSKSFSELIASFGSDDSNEPEDFILKEKIKNSDSLEDREKRKRSERKERKHKKHRHKKEKKHKDRKRRHHKREKFKQSRKNYEYSEGEIVEDEDLEKLNKEDPKEKDGWNISGGWSYKGKAFYKGDGKIFKEGIKISEKSPDAHCQRVLGDPMENIGDSVNFRGTHHSTESKPTRIVRPFRNYENFEQSSEKSDTEPESGECISDEGLKDKVKRKKEKLRKLELKSSYKRASKMRERADIDRSAEFSNESLVNDKDLLNEEKKSIKSDQNSIINQKLINHHKRGEPANIKINIKDDNIFVDESVDVTAGDEIFVGSNSEFGKVNKSKRLINDCKVEHEKSSEVNVIEDDKSFNVTKLNKSIDSDTNFDQNNSIQSFVADKPNSIKSQLSKLDKSSMNSSERRSTPSNIMENEKFESASVKHDNDKFMTLDSNSKPSTSTWGFPSDTSEDIPLYLQAIRKPLPEISKLLPIESHKEVKTPLIKRLGLITEENENIPQNIDSDFKTTMNDTELEEWRDPELFCSPMELSRKESDMTEYPPMRKGPRTPEGSAPSDDKSSPGSFCSPIGSGEYQNNIISPKSSINYPAIDKSTSRTSVALPITSLKKSPNQLDLDSRIKMIFDQKTVEREKSPVKLFTPIRNPKLVFPQPGKNLSSSSQKKKPAPPVKTPTKPHRKQYRPLSRPPSPFRNREHYIFWFRETFFFRKENRTLHTDIINPNKRVKMGIQIKEYKESRPVHSSFKHPSYKKMSHSRHRPRLPSTSPPSPSPSPPSPSSPISPSKSHSQSTQDESSINITMQENKEEKLDENATSLDANPIEDLSIHITKLGELSKLLETEKEKINIPIIEQKIESVDIQSADDKLNIDKNETENEVTKADMLVEHALSALLCDLRSSLKRHFTDELFNEPAKQTKVD